MATKEQMGALRRRAGALLANSDTLVFLDLPRVEIGTEDAVAEILSDLRGGLPSAILVWKSSPYAWRLV